MCIVYYVTILESRMSLQREKKKGQHDIESDVIVAIRERMACTAEYVKAYETGKRHR